jgi:biotin transporter BioY
MNIRKIMGADAGSLRFLTASEAPCFAMLSFVLGLIIIAWFSKSDFSSFFSADLSTEHNIILLATIGLAGIIFAILFGLYPARKVVSYPPAMALSGSFAQSKQSAALRNALIIIQFTAAIVLICVSGFIKLQHDYMTNQSWGFEKDHVLYLPFINADMSKIYETEIRQNPAIESVTLSNSIPGTVNQRWGTKVDNRDVSFAVWLVRPDFLDFFGINVISGRDFIPDDEGKMRVVCNEAFMKKFDFEKIEGAKMVSRGFEFVGATRSGIHSCSAADICYCKPLAIRFCLQNADVLVGFRSRRCGSARSNGGYCGLAVGQGGATESGKGVEQGITLTQPPQTPFPPPPKSDAAIFRRATALCSAKR